MSTYVFDANIVIDAPSVQEAHDKFCAAIETHPEISAHVSEYWFDEFSDQIPLDKVREAIHAYWTKQKDVHLVPRCTCVDLDAF